MNLTTAGLKHCLNQLGYITSAKAEQLIAQLPYRPDERRCIVLSIDRWGNPSYRPSYIGWVELDMSVQNLYTTLNG